MHKAVPAFTIQHYISRTPNREVQCHSCVFAHGTHENVTVSSLNPSFDFQNSSNANRGIYFISQNVMHWFKSIK